MADTWYGIKSSKWKNITTSYGDKAKKYRNQMGEKGIGRLAIASIDEKRVLIITKVKGSTEVTVAFINWQIFELPNFKS